MRRKPTVVKYTRGERLALVRGDVVDWTTFPLRSKPNGRRIERCPDCGRKGEASHYRTGGSMYIHTSRLGPMCWNVLDTCYVKGGAA